MPERVTERVDVSNTGVTLTINREITERYASLDEGIIEKKKASRRITAAAGLFLSGWLFTFTWGCAELIRALQNSDSETAVNGAQMILLSGFLLRTFYSLVWREVVIKRGKKALEDFGQNTGMSPR